MTLPYLNSKNYISSEALAIGNSHRNYFRPNILDDAFSQVGKLNRKELRQLYDTGKDKLKSAPKYSVSSAVETIKTNTPGVKIYSGEMGQYMTDQIAPGAGGTHGRRAALQIGQPVYITTVADELDNLAALQILAHETGHYKMGHSTSHQVPLHMKDGAPTYKPKLARQEINQAIKEVEAEATAAAIMNRLGYGYTSGVIDRSSSYIANWNSKVPQGLEAINARMIERVNQFASEVVPEPIRRFGPLSTRIANLVM